MTTKRTVLSRLLLATGGVAILAITNPATDAADQRPKAPNARVERGRYLVGVLACHDCHSPKKMGSQGPEPDLSRSLSGHPESPQLPAPPKLPPGPWMVTTTWDLTSWSGPWGVSYPINLTPDENTGIGSWSEDTFMQAIRTGRHMGVARPILPPMPWQVYRNLSDEDLRSVYAYLRTLKPIKNRVPEPVIAEASGVAGQ